MRRSLPLAIAGALAVVLGGPTAVALGHRHIVQPGDPGSAQYQEDVPTAQGSRPVTTLQAGTGPSATASATIPAATIHSLTKQGATGRAALSFAEQTAPVPASPSTAQSGSTPGHRGHAQILSYRATAAVGVLAGSLLGARGGMGVVLPLVIFLALAGAVALTIMRRRS